ncbi:fungal-specific transcription factor domain-containing protein [Bisporella sp. PMI_857]|nr:fungal-specific transcription factor domain-containing protein [Bisporella sp. PMI_857]
MVVPIQLPLKMPDKDAGSGMSKARHISTACTWCRNRKVKCDGKTPSCSNCVLYKQNCVYDYSDKRKQSHKKTVQLLQDRVLLLEDLLKKHGIKVPPASMSTPIEPQHSPLRDVGGEIADSQSDQSMHVPEGSLHLDESGGITEAGSTQPWQSAIDSWESTYKGYQLNDGIGIPLQNEARVHLNDTINVMPTLNSTSGNESIPAGASAHVSPQSGYFQLTSQSDDDDEDIMNQLSARIGSFQVAEDGQLRYFGATSNLHILHDGLSSLTTRHNRTARDDGDDVLARVGLTFAITPDLERHLEDLYFQWEDPAIHVVDQDMYFDSKNAYYSGQDGNPFYSETLKNAICAAGSCLTSRNDVGLPQEAATFFSSRAKVLLEIEMDSPLIATVQALVIMSATEAAFTRDPRGWLYSGMAVRLSADLGLHLDLTSDVRKGILSARELEVRRTTFWGVYIHDNMWSLYVGRPWSIDIQDISISRPSKELDKARHMTWNPAAISFKPSPSPNDPINKIYNPIEACTDANVSLCAVMRQLSKTLYSARTLSEETLQQFAASMRDELASWEEDLPADLRVDLHDDSKLYLPHILQLHMQFYAISILLHRPFFSRSLRNTSASNERGSGDPRFICISAAQSIINLLRIYRKQHTLSRTNVHIVHLVFTASLICVYNACTVKGAAATSNLADFQFCCQALSEIGQAYQNATRALEVIICIKREWINKSRNSLRKKRGLIAETDGLNGMGRKKRFTENNSEHFHTTSILATDIFGHRNSHQLGSWQFQAGSDGVHLGEPFFVNNIFISTEHNAHMGPNNGQHGSPF